MFKFSLAAPQLEDGSDTKPPRNPFSFSSINIFKEFHETFEVKLSAKIQLGLFNIL
jgi:hypothetical protein